MAGKHIHLIGICGTAMASLAGLLKQQDHQVTGSDAAVYPPMSDVLRELGIPVAQPYAEGNLNPIPDLVVVGNAISRGNVELEAVLDRRIPFQSLAQIVHEEFLAQRKSLVVAGTHGKTTTTSMLSWIFESAGKKPSFLIGGVAENFGSSFALRDSEHFIIEGDEYDTAFFDKGPKFMHYFPQAAILTSVEFDHADIYRDLDAVKTAFKRFVNLIPRSGRVIAFDAGENVTECLQKAFCKVERYGFSAAADWRIADVRFGSEQTEWRVFHNGAHWADFSFTLAGEHNVLNATAAAALAAGEGIAAADIANALATFLSVKRRLEVKAQVGGVTIIDDFAHHPTAITETLKALRVRYAGARLWAVLEPRSNTLRRKVFERELGESLALADEIVIAPVDRAGQLGDNERLSPEAVVEAVRARGRNAHQYENVDAIVEAVASGARAGDVVAILSNGGFGGIYEKLPKRIQSLSEVPAR